MKVLYWYFVEIRKSKKLSAYLFLKHTTLLPLPQIKVVGDFITLTKYKDSQNPRYIIQNWMRNRNTVEFLGIWESLYNPDFNRVEFDTVRSQAGLNSFVLTPQKWIEQINAIGIISKAGRYGGAYALRNLPIHPQKYLTPSSKLLIKNGGESPRRIGWTWVIRPAQTFAICSRYCYLHVYYMYYEIFMQDFW